MRYALALLLLGHGIAHLPGFLVGWQLASFPELPFRITVLAHTVDVGVVGARLVAVGWMIASLMFVVLAVAVALRPTGRPRLLPVALALSTLLCVLGWPEARIGLVSTVLMRARFLVILGTRAYEHTNPPVNRTIGNRTGVPQRYARNIGPSYWLDRSMARGAPAAEHRISGGTFGAVGWKLTV